MGKTAGPDDRGSGVIWTLAVGFVILTIGLVASLRCAAVVARHRAESAADFTALAAAAHALDGRAAACSVAAGIAQANNADLVSCQLRGSVVTVEVTAPVAGAMLSDWRAHARARAGP
jgi:secretion/DNA translocation related TadE-like protein